MNTNPYESTSVEQAGSSRLDGRGCFMAFLALLGLGLIMLLIRVGASQIKTPGTPLPVVLPVNAVRLR